MSITIEYKIPSGGAAVDFTDAERPVNYAKAMINRFININGRAERRGGMRVISSGAVAPGAPNLTRLHEWVSTQGSATLFTSDDNGNIYRYNGSASITNVKSGLARQRLLSAQSGDKLIFVNGTNRNFYTDDGGDTFKELLAIVNQGTCAAGTSATGLVDASVSAWLTQTNIANNDIVWNSTINAYGLVTNVSANMVTTTPMGPTATGVGYGFRAPQSGDSYILIDYVDLNIIKQPNGYLYDNIANAGTGTTTNVIAVSGVNFANTQIRTADFVYNTTRSAITYVNSVSANINVTAISGQTAGDSLVFFKSAMPIASYVHVHYGRTYFIDSRDKTKVRISAPDDPQDMTTFAKTLDSSSFDFGSQQPRGDQLTSIATFQNYFIAQGLKNVYVFSGINPIADTSASTITFNPLSFFPDGGVSRFGLASNGNDGIYMSPNGLQTINVGSESFINPRQTNLSAQNNNDFRSRIKFTPADNIQVYFYSKRQWILCKLGSIMWVFNVAPILTDQGDLIPKGSWTQFQGLWAEQNHFLVREDGVLYACGANGKIYILDDGDFTDAGTPIATQITTARYFLEEPQRTNRIKRGYYFRPLFESGGNIPYTFQAAGGWDNISSDSTIVTTSAATVIGNFQVGVSQIGGQTIYAPKVPLRWRGENVELDIQTNVSAGPDILSSITIYGEISGRR